MVWHKKHTQEIKANNKYRTTEIVKSAVNRNNNNNNKVKIQEFMNRDTTNVEPEMYDYTSNNWSHWNSNEKLKERFGSCTRKIFDRFSTKDSYTWNTTHNMESTAV